LQINSPTINSSDGKTIGIIVGIVVSIGVIFSVIGFLGYKFIKNDNIIIVVYMVAYAFLFLWEF